MDSFVLLAPILLLGVIALLGFIGCNQVFGLSEVKLNVAVNAVDPPSGTPDGGTAVRILGSGFEGSGFEGPGSQPALTVTFGGIAALNIQLISPSEIDALTPMHPAGAVEVNVTSTDGTSGTGSYTYAAVTHVISVPQTVGTGITTLALPLNFSQSRLVVATALWGGAASATLSGASFSQVQLDGLNPQKVAVFFANAVTGPVTVTATLSQASTTPWTLIVSVYDFANPTDPPDSAIANQGLGTNLTLNFPSATLSAGDLVYAVAVTRNAGSVLAGLLSAGLPFTGEAGLNDYIMIEDYVLTAADITAGQINVTAINKDPAATAASKWYLFAMRVKHS